MERLLKHALDNDAVGFIGRLKDKMTSYKSDVVSDITRETAADMAGVEVQESKKDPMHVFVHASGKGIKWRTSDQRTGGEANFSDPKDETALRAYFSRVFGKKKEFTLEIRESANEILVKNQFKDAFSLKDDVATPLVKKGLIRANKGKGTYSITDKGKNSIE